MTKMDFTEIVEIGNQKYKIWSLKKLEQHFEVNLKGFPYSIRALLEAQIREYAKGKIQYKELKNAVCSTTNSPISFLPSRVILQDYTGVPVLVDIASIRESVKEVGGDTVAVSPKVQTDLIVDHSIQVDSYSEADSLQYNVSKEYERNQERYKLLRWAENTFENFRVFPPGSGIIHQINLEYLATLIKFGDEEEGYSSLIPDSVLGTDSHTTMTNSLGILGWGVGGIEAESAILGESVKIPLPSVVGVRLKGNLNEGVTTTDLVLSLTERLRKENVVNNIVEFCGEGVKSLNLPDRATLSNMAPEFGATCAFFPVDQVTLDYLHSTGRSEDLVETAKQYYMYQNMFNDHQENADIQYDSVIDVNLNEIKSCISGPYRPQDLIHLEDAEKAFKENLSQNYNIEKNEIHIPYQNTHITHGSLLVAAITSCTNTSNPTLMIMAGLLAKKAVNKGLSVPGYVKTSFSPGSRVVTDYMEESNLMPYLNQLGFNVTGYGCMTCSGSGGPLDSDIERLVEENQIIASSVLSGNRNFEGRIHPLIKTNYLASPPMVIAFAIVGRIDKNLFDSPVGTNKEGKEIYLKDIWPSPSEVEEMITNNLNPQIFNDSYSSQQTNNGDWERIEQFKSSTYNWEEDSTYIKKPPYPSDQKEGQNQKLSNCRVLALLGDSITTDHISPGGVISISSPAGQYLLNKGVSPRDFNTYGSRRGNHEVMSRGTLSNVRLVNNLVKKEGGYTIHFPSKEEMSIYDAAMSYKEENTPLIILAGKEYGSGSSRDWAAKGPALLGVKAVIAESFERIHRTNLVNMGVLPLQFLEGQSWAELGIDGTETFTISLDNTLSTKSIINVAAGKHDRTIEFKVTVCIETEDELESYKEGGILNKLRNAIVAKGGNCVESLTNS